MDYMYIKKHLGEEWLTKQLEIFESKLWVNIPELRNKVSNEPTNFLLKKIDELIQKLENVKGFDKWVNEAKTSKTFEDCLFEIMIFENLLSKADLMEIKPNNPHNNKVPEALVVKRKNKFYIEAKKLRKIPNSSENKINLLLSNTRDKFKLSNGILFIGCFDFFGYDNDEVKIKKEIEELKKEVERKLNNSRENSRILAVALTNIYIQTDMKKSSLQKRFYLIPRPENLGGFNEKSLREIFDVDGFLVKENIFE